jgi:hypothetical protein
LGEVGACSLGRGELFPWERREGRCLPCVCVGGAARLDVAVVLLEILEEEAHDVVVEVLSACCRQAAIIFPVWIPRQVEGSMVKTRHEEGNEGICVCSK